ncbi:hypothetical protein IV04_20615 [Serratia sp. Ag1]|nr:hypothetical protein JV45_11845 [Serratia sp. Ag2]KFK95822.1 hypothetical protein IV04_20615 [Serratia sp. Ag1]
MRDLNDNAIAYDDFLNSEDKFTINRLGEEIPTIQGVLSTIDEATTQALEQTQQALDDAIRNVGYAPVSSFEKGFTLTSVGQALLLEATGVFYSWRGQYEKVVPPGSTPESTGGISQTAWVDVNDLTLRSDLSRPTGASIVKMSGGVSVQDWMHNDFVARFGGVSDYTGIPLYDGNDSSRISATDNAPMIINALTKGIVRNNTLFIFFPAGHYGFKKNNILIDGALLPYKNLVIAGEGADVTVLDYIMEDFENVGNNENTGAKELLTIKNFDAVYFYNITAKCTTKAGYVNHIAPGTGEDPIYNGTIWFAHITATKTVVCRDVISERGNYRGISINGRDLPLGQRTNVYLYNCAGRYTTGSGFWLRMCNLLFVDGGNFYRNGNLGITATGYGITCSQYVDNIFVSKAAFYENYRKGFDKHSGLGSFILKDCTFIDNVLWDVSSDHQYVAQYNPDITDDAVLDNCLFVMNQNVKFLTEAYAAIPAGKNKISVMLQDNLIDGTPANRQKSALLNKCTFKVLRPMSERLSSYTPIVSKAEETNISNSLIDLTQLQFTTDADKTVYSHTVVNFSRDNSGLVLSNVTIKLGSGNLSSSATENNNSLMFSAPSVGGYLIMDKNNIDMNNYLLVGTTSSGRLVPWNGRKKINGNTIKIRNLQHACFGQERSNAIYWLSSQFMFSGGSDVAYGSRNLLGLGDCTYMQDFSFGHGMSTPIQFVLPITNLDGSVKGVGSISKILTGQVDGNIHLALKGKVGLYTDKYEAFWDTAANVQHVLTGSYFIITAATLEDEVVKYKGELTNFTLKAISVIWTSPPPVTGYYVGEISCANQTALPFVGAE